MGCENEVRFATELAEVKARAESNSKRLNKLEELTDVVHELATAMRLMADKQERTATNVEQLGAKLTALEQAPTRRWKFVIEKIAISAIATIVGYMLAKLGIS